VTRVCGCRGKRKYRSFLHAVGAAIGNSKIFGKPMRPYRCPHKPGVWHLTTTTAQEYERRRGAT